MTTIVTGYNPAGLEEYGRVCLTSFARHWPPSINLEVYVERYDSQIVYPQILMRDISECLAFQVRHNNQEMRGRSQAPGKPWKAKYVKRGYNFRYDALKFSKMVFYTRHAAHRLKKGILAWMDGDVSTQQPVPPDFVDGLLPPTYDCAYLGRRGYHTDTGFVVFRLPQAMPLIDAWADLYANDSFLSYLEWHSAWLFDIARELENKVRCANIAADDRARYWADSPVGEFLTHHKGNRRKAELKSAS